jgi:hypothetical protein
MRNAELAARAIDEVVELHRFFEAWMGPAGAGDILRLAEALGPGFEMIVPSGKLFAREAVIAMVAGARGKRGTAARPFTIRIDDATAIPLGPEHSLVRYIERQDGDTDGPTARWSTALFRAAPAAPLGVVWLHLHETWHPESQPLLPRAS